MRTTATVTKVAPLLLSIATLSLGGVAAVHGESALDSFDPNANGIVRAIVVQADGTILLGGDFTTLSPSAEVARSQNVLLTRSV